MPRSTFDIGYWILLAYSNLSCYYCLIPSISFSNEEKKPGYNKRNLKISWKSIMKWFSIKLLTEKCQKVHFNFVEFI